MSSAAVVVDAPVTATAAAPACKFSLTLVRKVHRIKKMLKPMLDLVNKRCRKSAKAVDADAVSFCDAADSADQNSANEALEARLDEELRAGAGPGCAVAVWSDGRVRLREVSAEGAVAVPASFLTTSLGGLCWARPDADVLLLAGAYETRGLAAEQQVVAAASHHALHQDDFCC